MNRRLMMAQNKGFELVYDAASGLLPTECGWKMFQGSTSSMSLSNGHLKITEPKDTLQILQPIDEQFASNCSFEVEFYHSGTGQVLTLMLNDNISNLNFRMGTVSKAITIYQVWGENLYASNGIAANQRYIAKMIRKGNHFECYLNDILIYSENFSECYTSRSSFIIVNGTAATFIKRMVYKVY